MVAVNLTSICRYRGRCLGQPLGQQNDRISVGGTQKPTGGEDEENRLPSGTPVPTTNKWLFQYGASLKSFT